jgi:hypothetical protein
VAPESMHESTQASELMKRVTVSKSSGPAAESNLNPNASAAALVSESVIGSAVVSESTNWWVEAPESMYMSGAVPGLMSVSAAVSKSKGGPLIVPEPAGGPAGPEMVPVSGRVISLFIRLGFEYMSMSYMGPSSPLAARS